MSKIRRAAGVVCVAMVSLTFLPVPLARPAITGSAHDFGKQAWAGYQVCQPCHTPHNAITRDTTGVPLAAPLWNHTLSSATYILYTDASGAAVTGKIDENSKLCLSCHDGTVALDSYGGLSGTFFIKDSHYVLGTDLSNDHPMGEHAVWPTPNPPNLVDPSLRDALGIMPLRTMSDGRLVVGCTSCHEPHNRMGTTKMLWVSNTAQATTVDGRTVSGSALCMNCHVMDSARNAGGTGGTGGSGSNFFSRR